MVSANVGVTTARALFKGPGEQVNGLEATPEGLWLCDQRDNRSYLVDFDGHMRTSFPARLATRAASPSAQGRCGSPPTHDRR